MVHDPRVSACLARLGGVYRDPGRVDRDAASLLKSSVGANLIPIVAEMYENNGNRSNVLVLQGTIAMHFRGQTYQLLMDTYLPAGYPNRPPVPFVRLAPNMYLKENHRHVGSDGKVYLPYLHEWRGNTHNLVELVVAMSSVFSADPPVFTRRPNSLNSASSSTTTATGFGSTTRPAMDASATANGAALSDEEAIAAVQAQEAAEAERKRQAEAEQERQRIEEERQKMEQERKRIEEERENQRALDAQREWERQRTEQVRVQVTAKIRQQLADQARQTQQTIGTDLARDLRLLQLAKEQKIEAPLQAMKEQQQQLEQQLVVAEESKLDIEAWIEQAERAKSETDSGGGAGGALTVDEKVVPERPLHAQMMDLSAENAALTDALYFLDRAMHSNHLSCEQHLKQVRRLAKRQFLVRAHLIKINQVILSSSSSPPPMHP